MQPLSSAKHWEQVSDGEGKARRGGEMASAAVGSFGYVPDWPILPM